MILLCLSDSIIDKTLPTVISTTFVVLLFVIGRILDSFIKRQEIKRNWYQKIIIDPNIAKVDLFYKDIILQSKESIDFLIQNKSTPHDKYLTDKMKEIEKFKVIKRKFEFEFISMVQTNYPEIASDLSAHLRNIEDDITTLLDKSSLVELDKEVLERNIISQKHFIYQILYLPLV